jgi:hypothetical protein
MLTGDLLLVSNVAKRQLAIFLQPNSVLKHETYRLTPIRVEIYLTKLN